jgi:hypothetical protein
VSSLSLSFSWSGLITLTSRPLISEGRSQSSEVLGGRWDFLSEFSPQVSCRRFMPSLSLWDTTVRLRVTGTPSPSTTWVKLPLFPLTHPLVAFSTLGKFDPQILKKKCLVFLWNVASEQHPRYNTIFCYNPSKWSKVPYVQGCMTVLQDPDCGKGAGCVWTVSQAFKLLKTF